jgi:hypothetical protein
MQGGQEVQGIVAHNKLALLIGAIRMRGHEICHEARIVVCNLSLDVVDFMAGIQNHLTLSGFDLHELFAVRLVDAWFGSVHAFQLRVDRFETAKHLIEGMVLEHQENNVFDRIIGPLLWVHGLHL